MPESDVSFTFDTKQFENGIKTLNKGMKGMQTTATTVAKGVAAGMVVATTAVEVFKLAIRGAKKLLGRMLSGMPEVGKAFKIARDIIFKNFLFPIRKAIMPLLQRMLDWVRDHRSMFVKWGSIVVGIFKVIFRIGQRVVKVLRNIWEATARILSSIFGREIRRVSDLMNIMAFKIAATIIFLSALLGPLFSKIGEIAEKIAEFGLKAVKDFFEGFIEGAPGASEAIGAVLDSLKDLFQTLIDINEETGLFTKIFKSFGVVAGFLFVGAMQNIEYVIKSATFAIRGLITGLELLNEQRKIGEKRDPAEIKRLKTEREALREEEAEWLGGWLYKKGEGWKKLGETLGGILGGEPMVQENKTEPGSLPVNTYQIGTITLIVPPGTTESQARGIVEGIEDAALNQYNREVETTGR